MVPRKRCGPGDVGCHSQTYVTAKQGLKSDAMDRLLALKGAAPLHFSCWLQADQECSAQHSSGGCEELKTEVFRRSSRLLCPSSTWLLGS